MDDCWSEQWQNKTVLLNQNYNCFNRNRIEEIMEDSFFVLCLPKLSICHFYLHSFSIDSKFQSCMCSFLFFCYSMSCEIRLNASFTAVFLDFLPIFLFLVGFLVVIVEGEKIKVARGNCWVCLENQGRSESRSANHSIQVWS